MKPIFVSFLQALKKLRYSGLQPYVIFIASPRLERLQLTRQIVSEKVKKNISGSSGRLVDEDSLYTVSYTYRYFALYHYSLY